MKSRNTTRANDGTDPSENGMHRYGERLTRAPRGGFEALGEEEAEEIEAIDFSDPNEPYTHDARISRGEIIHAHETKRHR